MQLAIPIQKCTVVSCQTDIVTFDIAQTPDLEVLHDGYDEWNNRLLSISTVRGNGPAMVRTLGYPGEIEVIDTTKRQSLVIPAGIFPGGSTESEWKSALARKLPISKG